MILIDKITVNNIEIRFYNGIDFNILKKHDKTGKDGFIYCFIDNWVGECKSYDRECLINSIINNENFTHFNPKEIENNYISIWTTQGLNININDLYKTVKDRIIGAQYENTLAYRDRGIITSWNFRL